MANGVVIHLDNDSKGILEPSKNFFVQLGLDLDYISCQTKEEFNQAVNNNKIDIKALIFDLLSKEPSKEELHQEDAEFFEVIRTSFAKYNIPIFIYSGYLQALDNEFEGYGTVFKTDKQYGIKPVFDKLKLLLESGFIDVFCPGGVLETEIKDELHNSFIRQFTRNDQIEEVIKSISEGIKEDPKQLSDRVKKIFKRITIKTLASDLLAPIADSEDKVHPIEHFYKRQSKLDIWTGDIWKEKVADNYILVLTPRCDFATGKAETIIYININELPKPISLNGNPADIEKRMRDYLTDNLQGKSTRYIPSNTFFPSGGMATMNEHSTVQIDDFKNNFEYVITLSDDLTNEIIGKFAYYFLRTGITNINEYEFEAIIRDLNSQGNNAKK
ncbi:MAG: hypothetical protein OEW75_05550 [Cyclobacteriaceae bacterium]|nr:hypothetical protein [Cyclobacteriaceae bacterium]